MTARTLPAFLEPSCGSRWAFVGCPGQEPVPVASQNLPGGPRVLLTRHLQPCGRSSDRGLRASVSWWDQPLLHEREERQEGLLWVNEGY